MTTYHISKNGEPGVCKAKKDACPLGGEHGSKEQIQKESERIFAEKFNHIPTSSNLPVQLRETKEGIELFETYKKKWKDQINTTFEKYYGKSADEFYADSEKEAREARSVKGNYDGAWIEPNADGSISIPAGDYVFFSADGWRNDSSYEEDPEKTNSLDKWRNQAWLDTAPGTVGGAYLDGKPSYFVSSWGMGQNHGYDGEILMSKDSYDKLIEEGKITADTDFYGTADVKVERDTKFYGDLGNPALSPKDMYMWDAVHESPEAKAIYYGETTAPGILDDNPSIHITKKY